MPLQSPLLYPNTTGPVLSYGHIEIKAAGIPFVGFKKITYGRTRTREMMRGGSPDPLGKSLGENEYKAAMEVYTAEFNLWLSQLAAKGALSGYGDFFFDTTVTHNATGFTVVTDTIKGCSLDTTEADNSQGPSPLTRSFELNPLKILFNGLDDLGASLQSLTVFANLSI